MDFQPLHRRIFHFTKDIVELPSVTKINFDQKKCAFQRSGDRAVFASFARSKSSLEFQELCQEQYLIHSSYSVIMY